MQYSELRHQDERTKVYLGSPALLKLDDGVLLASHDYFHGIPGTDGESALTSIYRSEDDGVSWRQVTHIIGAFWMTLFSIGNDVYGIGCSREYGDVVIRRSTDGGFTWSHPSDTADGILLRGGPGRENPNWQTTPAATVWNNRIYLPLDNMHTFPGGPRWAPKLFHTCVLSAPADADLLNASSWTLSNELPFDFRKIAEPELADEKSGWLEGNVVPTPENHLVNIIRMHLNRRNRAGMLNLSGDGLQLDFDGSTGVIDFPGGSTNFKIRRDPVTGLYLAFADEIIGDYETIRNFLVLTVSRDLRHWRRATVAMRDDSGFEPEQSKLFSGFQYADWAFDGDDLIYLVRAAYRGAHNFHDSNRILFRRMKNFRRFLEEI